MTGKSGRARSRYAGPAEQNLKIDCSSLSALASIAAPNVAVVADLEVGRVLGVELRANPQSVVATLGAEVVGGLVPVELADIISCLRQGFRFSATVVRVDGAYCEVHIRCVGKP